MSEVSSSEMKIMCENTLKFFADTRPENDYEESGVESAIWKLRAKAKQEMKDNKVFIGIVAGEKLFFASTGDSAKDELKQTEIVEKLIGTMEGK